MKNHNSLPTVSIGVAAYNEERNIKNFLDEVFSQNYNGLILEEVIVASDGSNDSTVEICKSYPDHRIKLIHDQNRLGKPLRLNQIMRICKSDVLVILDADIDLVSKCLVIDLVKPIINRSKVELSSGVAVPYSPVNFAERVVCSGLKIWEDVKKRVKGTEMYKCEGQVRAFSRKLYSELNFPNASADDVFPYLYSQVKGYKFVSVPYAVISFKVPSTFKDYIKQMKRFLKSRMIQEASFDKELVKSNFVINPLLKFKVLALHFLRNPLYVSFYVILHLIPTVLYRFEIHDWEAVWTIIESTKHLHHET